MRSCHPRDNATKKGRPHEGTGLEGDSGRPNKATSRWGLACLSVDFHFDVVVHVVGGVALAVKADVLALGTFAIDDVPEAAFDVGLVATFAEA